MTASAARSPGAPRMVVLRALGLGDLCTAVPALRALRRAHPSHRIALLTPRPLWPVIEPAGVADELVDHRSLDAPLPAELRYADLAVNLHGRGPQSSRLLLAAEPAQLLAFAHAAVPATGAGPIWRADEHEVDRWCRLAATLGGPAERTDVQLPQPAPAQDSMLAGRRVVVHPGAASPARRWPVERFGAVVRFLLDDGREVVVTGGADEADLGAAVAASAGAAGDPRCVVAAGRTDLTQLMGLIAGAALVIAGDTGVAHLATAFATPSVLLFGPTPPIHWGPTTAGPHRVLWAGTVGDPHGTRPDPGLLAITTADVISAIDALHTALGGGDRRLGGDAHAGPVRSSCDPAGGGWRRSTSATPASD